MFALIKGYAEIKERDLKTLDREELERMVYDRAVWSEDGPEIVETYETREEAVHALEAVKNIWIKHCGGSIPVCHIDYYAAAKLIMSENEDYRGEKYVEDYEIEAERMPIEEFKRAEEGEEEEEEWEGR